VKGETSMEESGGVCRVWCGNWGNDTTQKT